MALHVVEHEHEGVIDMHVDVDDGEFREFVAVLVEVFILDGVEGRFNALHSDALLITCHRM